MTESNDSRRHPLLGDEMEARRLLVAVPIANEGPLAQAERDKIIATLNGYIEKHEIRHDEVAKACRGINVQIVSQIRRNVYHHGTLDDHLRTLNNWMEIDARRRQAQRPKKKLTDTFVVKIIKSAVDMCRQNSTMGYVTGPAGIGKTVTARTIADTDPGCVYMQINSFNCTRQPLLKELCDKLKVGDANTRKKWGGASRFERLRSALENSHYLLIFDDADKLRENSLETIREIHDAFRVPVLLIGVVEIAERIRQSTNEDRGQLESRFGIKFDVRKAKSGGGKKTDAPIFSIDDIRKIFNQPGLRLAGGADQYLKCLANANGLGGIRRCEHLVFLAARLVRSRRSKGANQTITVTEKELQFAVDNSDVMRFDDKTFRESQIAARSA